MQQSAPPQPAANPNPGAAKSQWRSSLLLRSLTAIVGIPTILILLWFGGWAVFAALAVVIGWASYEMHRMLTGSGMRPLSALSLALSLDFLVAAVVPIAWRVPLIEGGITLLLLASLTWLVVGRKTLDGSLVDWALTMAVPFYIGWSLSFFQRLRGNAIGFSPGFWWVFVVLVGTWVFDSAAFFAGGLLGRHKLATLVSPSKTWEGVIGGIVGAVAVTLLTTLPLHIPLYHAIILGVLISLASQIGDLAESLIKRQTHVKDSSHLIPGHGGILDRIDSLLFTVMIVYLYVSWVFPQMLSA